MRFLAALLLFPVMLFAATESVSIDTKTKKVQNPIVNFGAGNTLNGTGATIIGFPGSSYTFIDSLTQSAGNVSLVNDSASPGNSKYYGTDSGGVLGFHTVTGGGGSFLSANTARVDPSGNDGTGTVGDLNKPFLTVQAAINAIALALTSSDYAVIDIGDNHFSQNLTIDNTAGDFPILVFKGVTNNGNNNNNSIAFTLLTITADGNQTDIRMKDCGVGNITADSPLILLLDSANFQGNAITSTASGSGKLTIGSAYGTGELPGTITADNTDILIFGMTADAPGGSLITTANRSVIVGNSGQSPSGSTFSGTQYTKSYFSINAPNGTVTVNDSLLHTVTCTTLLATRTTIDTLTASSSASLTDSRIGTNLGVDPTYTDVLLKLAGTNTPLGDPNANRFIGWDDTDNLAAYFALGSGLTYTHSTHTVSVNTPTPTATSTPTSTATPTATPTATASATATPTPSATATAFPQGFTAHFSRGGAALQTNDVTLTPWTTKYPGTITGFIISADQGTCTLKVWKKATGTAIPTIADAINTSGVSLATGTHIDSTTVTDFTTTTVSVGDQFMAQVTAVSGGATDITFQIPIRQ